MGKLRDWMIKTIKEDDDDYEYDENGHLIHEDDITLEDSFDDFFRKLDKSMNNNKNTDEIDDENIDETQDDLPEFDPSGKRIIYVYDKNFDPKNYQTSLNCIFKKHPLSDKLPDYDETNYSDSEKIIKLSDYKK